MHDQLDADTLRSDFVPWLDQVDALAGHANRARIGVSFSWVNAFEDGLTPAQALACALRLEAALRFRTAEMVRAWMAPDPGRRQ